jgi:hypothetical protein
MADLCTELPDLKNFLSMHVVVSVGVRTVKVQLEVGLRHNLVTLFRSGKPCSLDNASNSPDFIASNDRVTSAVSWTGCGRKRSWPALRCRSGVCVPRKTSVRIVSEPTFERRTFQIRSRRTTGPQRSVTRSWLNL